MKSWKKIIGLSLAGVAVLTAMSGCGSSDKKASSSSDKLLMYEIGQKPKNFDKLLAVVNKEVKKASGMELDVQFMDYGDYTKKMSVIVSSGENYDIAFADNYALNAQKGAYADLTKLLPKYAESSYKQLDKAYIDGNTINGKLYAMPVNANVYSQQVLTFDKSLLDKYDLSIDNVKTYDDLAPLLKVIKEKEPAITPLATGPTYKVYENYDDVLDSNMPFAVSTSGDTAKIVNKFDQADVQKDLKTMHEFYQEGYIKKDAATSTSTTSLSDKTWFVTVQTQGPFDYGDTILSNAAGHELVSAPITEKVKKNANARMANFVVSATSKHKTAAVKAINVLNSNAKALNTLVYGIEGDAWEKTSDNKAKLLDGYKPDYHLSAWNTGNNMTVYPPSTVTDEQIAQRDANIKEATYSPLLGCNFDTDKVKTEISSISNVMTKYQIGLTTGTLDPDETIPKMDKELKAAGSEKVMKELQSQYDAFLKTK
jgi:putative aldouronate transport system substrate-binding protein